MPDHKLHLVVDHLVLGRGYPEVHKFLDQFQPVLQSNHRMYLHDKKAVELVWQATGDYGTTNSAILHIILDNMSDEYGQVEGTVKLLRACLLSSH